MNKAQREAKADKILGVGQPSAPGPEKRRPVSAQIARTRGHSAGFFAHSGGPDLQVWDSGLEREWAAGYAAGQAERLRITDRR